MSKNQISAPVPSLGTRVTEELKAHFKASIKWIAVFYGSVLQEEVSHRQALWLILFSLSFIALLLFASAECYLLTLAAAFITLLASRKAGMSEKGGGQ